MVVIKLYLLANQYDRKSDQDMTNQDFLVGVTWAIIWKAKECFDKNLSSNQRLMRHEKTFQANMFQNRQKLIVSFFLKENIFK